MLQLRQRCNHAGSLARKVQEKNTQGTFPKATANQNCKRMYESTQLTHPEQPCYYVMCILENKV